MRNMFLALTIFCFSALPSYGAQWIDLSSYIAAEAGTETLLSGIDCVSNTECWVSRALTGEVYHTANGGFSWETQTTEYGTGLHSIAMIDSNTGYCTGAGGFIYRTTNGGVTWNSIGSTGVTMTRISCPPGGASCYAVGNNGKAVKITGTTITTLTSNSVSTISGVSFPTSDSPGWFCGENAIRRYNGTVFEANQTYTLGSYSGVHFISNTEGWIVGDRILYTTDGFSWTVNTDQDNLDYYLVEVFFLNNQEGWATGVQGSILYTQNGGTTWSTILSQYTGTNTIRSVVALDSNNVFIAGNGGVLLSYTDNLPPVPRAQVDKNNIYFGEIAIGDHKDEVITLSNTGTADLIVGTVAQANPLALPFSKEVDNCSGQTLTPSSTCTITTRFTPTTHSDYSDTFDIPTNATPSTITISLNSGVKPFPWTMFMPACAKPK